MISKEQGTKNTIFSFVEIKRSVFQSNIRGCRRQFRIDSTAARRSSVVTENAVADKNGEVFYMAR